MENKKQLGGKRKGAGRKPVLSKKKQISLYVEGSKILKFGSEEKYKEFLYRQTDEYGVEKDYSNPVSELNKLPQYSVHEIKQPLAEFKTPVTYTETKSTVTGLPPKLSDFENLMDELNTCSTIPQVEAVMKKVKSGLLLPREKMTLEAHAKDISKDMFND